MKIKVIFRSVHHGNTEKIARSMAAAFGGEVLSPEEFLRESPTAGELLGFGSGIFFGSFHKDLEHAVLTTEFAHGTKAFVFSTSGLGKKSYNEKLISMLQNKGVEVLGSFACRGFDTYGPWKIVGGIAKGHPDEDDLKKAAEFIKVLTKDL